MHSLKARKRKTRAGLRLEKLEDRHQDDPKEGGEIRPEAEPFQVLSEELTATKDPYQDTCSSG